MNNFGAQVLAINNDPEQIPVEMLWVACRNPIAQDPEASVSYKAFDSIDFIVRPICGSTKPSINRILSFLYVLFLKRGD